MARSVTFLSTPSARRATLTVHTRLFWCINFYPRPPRGGRPLTSSSMASTSVFLSTPSARRATAYTVAAFPAIFISIHALREEGDGCADFHSLCVVISIHALREEGDGHSVPDGKSSGAISIHALREEGDLRACNEMDAFEKFLSTPSARRATQAGEVHRYGRPISIHALREEGDAGSRPRCRGCGNFYPRPPRGGRPSRTTTPSFSERFLSTPSARRATVYFASCARQDANFYPRPPRGGRRPTPRALPGKVEFLSTPSARRATWCGGCDITPMTISIHALREEGDGVRDRGLRPLRDFYPRPPRGGRPAQPRATAARGAISIHALREEGDPAQKAPDRPGEISIHALREEGDPSRLERGNLRKHFYPRPPRGGRRPTPRALPGKVEFLSTPSARRATEYEIVGFGHFGISIHALREEGDPGDHRRPRARPEISIHALREEGDSSRRRARRR